MNPLLDTHALLWWLSDEDRLSRAAYDAIADSSGAVFVSAASAWEIATKHRLGRLPEADVLAQDIPWYIADQGFRPLAITVQDAEYAGRLPGHHQDPFDRMLIAQALMHDLALVSNERRFDRYGVNRVW